MYWNRNIESRFLELVSLQGLVNAENLYFKNIGTYLGLVKLSFEIDHLIEKLMKT